MSVYTSARIPLSPPFSLSLNYIFILLCDGSCRICVPVRGWAQPLTSELITPVQQGLSDAAIAKKPKTLLVNVKGKQVACLTQTSFFLPSIHFTFATFILVRTRPILLVVSAYHVNDTDPNRFKSTQSRCEVTDDHRDWFRP